MNMKWIFFVFAVVAAFSTHTEAASHHGAGGRHGADGAVKHRNLTVDRPSVRNPASVPNLNEKF
jgi:hypothetical protein